MNIEILWVLLYVIIPSVDTGFSEIHNGSFILSAKGGAKPNTSPFILKLE